MERLKSLRRLCIALAVIFAGSSFYLLLTRAIQMFISRFGTAEIIMRFLTVNSTLNTILFAALPMLLLFVMLGKSEGKLQRAVGVLALSFGLEVIRHIATLLFSGQSYVMLLSLGLVCARVLIVVMGFLLLAFSQKDAKELRVCGIIAAVLYFLHGITTALSLAAGIMLTGSGYLPLWVAVMSYSGTADFLISIAKGPVMALSFLMLLYSLRETAEPVPTATEIEEKTE